MDLTYKLAPFLDLHLLIKLLEFLRGKNVYDEGDLVRGLAGVVDGTERTDYVAQLFSEIGELTEGKRQELETQASTREKNLESYYNVLSEFIDLSGDTKRISELEAAGDLSVKNLNQTEEDDDVILQYFFGQTKLVFESGDYEQALKQLQLYRKLSSDAKNSTRNSYSAFGVLACELLLIKNKEDVDAAERSLEKIKEVLDHTELNSEGTNSALSVLQKRSWMLHWSLFLFFNNASQVDLSKLIEFFLVPKHLNTIQLNCPWLLRYLACAVVIVSPGRKKLSMVLSALKQEEDSFSDPITKFLQNLLFSFDFDGAQESLAECSELFETDYFLFHLKERFETKAKALLFETYCRVHETIDIAWLAERLGIDPETGVEAMVLKLVTKSKIDAKIDSAKGHLILGRNVSNIHQQTIDKTKDLAYRSYQLVSATINSGK